MSRILDTATKSKILAVSGNAAFVPISTILKMFYLYILESVRFGTYYIGVSKAPEERARSHNSGKVRSTKHKRPWRKIYQEKFKTLAMARRRELYLKSLKKRSAIEKIIKHFKIV